MNTLIFSWNQVIIDFHSIAPHVQLNKCLWNVSRSQCWQLPRWKKTHFAHQGLIRWWIPVKCTKNRCGLTVLGIGWRIVAGMEMLYLALS